MITLQTTNTKKEIMGSMVAIMSTPETFDKISIDALAEKNSQNIIADFYNWTCNISEVSDRIVTSNFKSLSNNAGTFSLLAPHNIKIGIISSTGDQEMTPLEVMDHFTGDVVDIMIYMPNHAEDFERNIAFKSFDDILVIDKNWLASIIVEKSLPFFTQLGGRTLFGKTA